MTSSSFAFIYQALFSKMQRRLGTAAPPVQPLNHDPARLPDRTLDYPRGPHLVMDD